jgi:hypothetical protein
VLVRDCAGGVGAFDHELAAGGMWSAKIGDPWVVRSPAVSRVSLWAIGNPWRGPSGSPDMVRT